MVAMLMALALMGCEAMHPSAAANDGGGMSGSAKSEGASGPASSSGATRVEYVKDPTLNNMNAFGVTMPAKWHFQGVLIQGGNCASLPFMVLGVGRGANDRFHAKERLPAFEGSDERAGFSEVPGGYDEGELRKR
jgi:hypothetical protein